MTDKDALAALTQLQALAITMHREACGDVGDDHSSVEERIAVGCVVRNRLKSGRWGADYKAACLAPKQFSCWIPAGGERNYEATMALARLVTSDTPDPLPLLFRETLFLAAGIINGKLLDATKGSTNYFAAWMTQPPTWAAAMQATVKIGSHLFFREVRP